jgi:hypothetical protein
VATVYALEEYEDSLEWRLDSDFIERGFCGADFR